jgi:hypothetical protein
MLTMFRCGSSGLSGFRGGRPWQAPQAACELPAAQFGLRIKPGVPSVSSSWPFPWQYTEPQVDVLALYDGCAPSVRAKMPTPEMFGKTIAGGP